MTLFVPQKISFPMIKELQIYAAVCAGGLYPDVSRILVPATFSQLPATAEHFGIEQISAQSRIFYQQNINLYFLYLNCMSRIKQKTVYEKSL